MNESTTNENNWGIVGHEKIISTFRDTIKNNKLSHAYLFVGSRSLGKMTVAKKLIETMYCEGEVKPCGECRSCKSIQSNHNQDVYIIEKDKVKIEDIREMQRGVSLKSFSGKSKVVVIDNIDSFNQESANSMLKILEEPKGKLRFILIASNLENVIPTIISRCVPINFNLVSTEKIETAIGDRIDGEKRTEIARKAMGRPGIAFNFLENDSLIEDNEKLESIIATMITQSFARSLQNIGKWKNEEAIYFTDVLLDWYRDMLFYKIQNHDLIVNVTNIDKYYSKFYNQYSMETLRGIIEQIVKSKEMLYKNANTKLVLENLIIKIKI